MKTNRQSLTPRLEFGRNPWVYASDWRLRWICRSRATPLPVAQGRVRGARPCSRCGICLVRSRVISGDRRRTFFFTLNAACTVTKAVIFTGKSYLFFSVAVLLEVGRIWFVTRCAILSLKRVTVGKIDTVRHQRHCRFQHTYT